MRAGRLREVLVIVAPSSATNRFGQPVPGAGSDGATIRAEVRTESAKEVRASGRIVDQVQYFVTTARLEALNLTTRHKLRWTSAPGGSRTLNITGFLEPNPMETTILATEEARG